MEPYLSLQRFTDSPGKSRKPIFDINPFNRALHRNNPLSDPLKGGSDLILLMWLFGKFLILKRRHVLEPPVCSDVTSLVNPSVTHSSDPAVTL